MKHLIEYINTLFNQFEYELLLTDHLKTIETKSNEFIYKNYPILKHMKYISVEVNRYDVGVVVKIHPEFKKEMNIYYPEKLI